MLQRGVQIVTEAPGASRSSLPAATAYSEEPAAGIGGTLSLLPKLWGFGEADRYAYSLPCIPDQLSLILSRVEGL